MKYSAQPKKYAKRNASWWFKEKGETSETCYPIQYPIHAPPSPDLAERIIRKAKRIRQRAQIKPRQNSVLPEEATQKTRPMKKTASVESVYLFYDPRD